MTGIASNKIKKPYKSQAMNDNRSICSMVTRSLAGRMSPGEIDDILHLDLVQDGHEHEEINISALMYSMSRTKITAV